MRSILTCLFGFIHLFFNHSCNIQIMSEYLLGARLGWCLVYNYNRKAEIKAQNWEQVHRRPIYIEYIFHIFFKTFVSFLPIWHSIFCLPHSKSRPWRRGPSRGSFPLQTPTSSSHVPQESPSHSWPPFRGSQFPPDPRKVWRALADTWTTHTASATSPETLEQWLCFILFKKNS